jgi:PKD repeat protein
MVCKALLRSVYVFCVFTLLSHSASAQLAITPSTTLSTETSNNTSASLTFRAQTNGNEGLGNVSKASLRSLLYPGAVTKIYASVMPWFGSPSHMSIGYTSSDPAQIASQINDMRSRGIQGAIIPWYGQSSYNATMAMNFMQAAQSSGNFEFSLRLEGGALQAYAQQNGCDVTTELINQLNYIASTFYGSPAYSRIGGRPVIHFFGVESYYVDWNKVRASIASDPVFIMRNRAAFSDPTTDGGFSWLQTNSTNPNDEMLSYLDGFYTAAQSSSKNATGSIYKGFNDTLAAWSANRIINQQCGLTWLDTFAEAGKYYSSANQLDAIQVVTWNDYEEGTEIETGVDNCVALAPLVSGPTLSWSIGSKASERTIDHYTVFISTDGQNLMKLADVAAGKHSLDLSQYNVAVATYVLYVKAVGKASIVNHVSPAVAYHPGDQPPVASLSVSPSSGAAPLAVTASSANSSDPDGSINAVRIDYGDGTVASGGAGLAASHTYQARGTYTVTLTVFDNAGVFSTTRQTVTVAAGPGVTITSPTSGANVKSPVHVSATGLISGGVGYMEVFVDNGPTPAYITAGSAIDTQLQIAAGTHTLRVVAHDTTPAATAISSYVTFTVGAGDAPPNAVLGVEPFGSGNQVMACTATSTDPDGFISASKINFGDGVTASGPTALHTYASVGTYQVTATVTDNAGVSSTTSSSVTVASAASVTGAVTNVKTGSPLAGAKVSLGGSSTTADSTGHYSFSNVAQGAYVLTASAPGYLSRSYNTSVTSGTLTQNVALSTAGVLQGKVSNGSGVGVAGATVSISGGALSSSFSAATSSGGSYNFGWVPIGTYTVTATASGYASSFSSTSINTGQTTTLNVLLSTAAASINGRVTSAADGHALAGAKVSTGSATTTTDTNGNYTLSSVAAGSYTITASSTGRLPASTTISLTAGSQLVHNFQLSTAGVLKGKISTSGGSGVGGVRITFTGGAFNSTNSVIADASGDYNAGYIPIGNYLVSVTASGVTKTSSVSIASGATTTLNFTF